MTNSTPRKRLLRESSNLQNIAESPKRRKANIVKLDSSQGKSVFESDVLEKLNEGLLDSKRLNTEKDQTWERPPLQDLSPNQQSLCFQSIEAEEGTLHGGASTVKLFGITSEGNSVMLHVSDFKHYLYVAVPPTFGPEDCNAYTAYLETQVGQYQPAIHSVSLALRESIYGFQGNQRSHFLKVTVTDPKFINKVRSTIENGHANWKGLWNGAEGGIKTYDNIQYLLRFMVDCQVSDPVIRSTIKALGLTFVIFRSRACLG